MHAISIWRPSYLSGLKLAAALFSLIASDLIYHIYQKETMHWICKLDAFSLWMPLAGLREMAMERDGERLAKSHCAISGSTRSHVGHVVAEILVVAILICVETILMIILSRKPICMEKGMRTVHLQGSHCCSAYSWARWVSLKANSAKMLTTMSSRTSIPPRLLADWYSQI